MNLNGSGCTFCDKFSLWENTLKKKIHLHGKKNRCGLKKNTSEKKYIFEIILVDKSNANEKTN